MGFTKEQRLKGLMKQLKNLGIETSDSPPAEGDLLAKTAPLTAEELDKKIDAGERGARTLYRMRAKQDMKF